MKILLCDDDRESLEYLKKFLIGNGHDTLAVYCKDEAVKSFQQDTYDLVFLDIAMPDADGFETLRALKKYQPDIKAVMMTGAVVEEEKAKDLGVFDYLYKPVDFEKLLWVLEKIRNSKSEIRNK